MKNKVKENVIKYLKNNNLKASDIKDSVVTFESGHFYLKVTFTNNIVHPFRIFPYKLNKFGALFLGGTILTTSIGISGTLGNFKFSERENNVYLKNRDKTEEVSLLDDSFEEIDSLVIEPEDKSYLYEETNDINDIYVDSNVEFENVDYEELDPYELIDVSNNKDFLNCHYKEINTYGSLDPCIDSYDYVLDRYYEPINRYGNMYGVDPAIIAALIMQESGTDDSDYYQTNYNALGLGQINCSFFDNYTFHIYNYELGDYEDYTCTYEKLKNDRDEQIKVIAIMLQDSANRYNGNLAAMLISYNQGSGTLSNVVKNVISNTDYDSFDEVLDADDITIIPAYNFYTYGDPNYFSKVVTFINYELENNAFGNSTAIIKVPGSDDAIEYKTNLEVSSLKGAR